MNKTLKIILTVLSVLSFFSVSFWGSVYYLGGLSHLYYSQDVVKSICIFLIVLIAALAILVTIIILMFKSKKVIRIVCSVLLAVFIPSAFVGSFFEMFVMMIIAPNGCSYTEDIANYGKYDNDYKFSHFPEYITEDMIVVRYSYFYKYIDVTQLDVYLEVKFKDVETMDKYLTKAKNSFSEKGVLSYPNPYNPKYTDVVENTWALVSDGGSFATSIYFDSHDSGTKYVDMNYDSITYSFDELTIIYNSTSIGNDIFVGNDPDNGEYYPKYLERFGVKWNPDNNFQYEYVEGSVLEKS